MVLDQNTGELLRAVAVFCAEGEGWACGRADRDGACVQAESAGAGGGTGLRCAHPSRDRVSSLLRR